ncbi:MAG TPA: UDP-N-acetylmuramoyl-L-alanyl-D-glutamate--2,6-diaminopimelate ligase [Bacillota bacterium]
MSQRLRRAVRLRRLLEDLADWDLHGSGDPEIRGIAYDSRHVQEGDLFVPWRGGRRFGDGHRFIPDALARGAAAVVAQRDAAGDLPALPDDVPLVLVGDSRRALAALAARFFEYPSSRLRLIGVTGTNGKTTTTHLIRDLLEAAGRGAGLIGTVRYVVGDRVRDADRTTPQAPDIQALLSEMIQAGLGTAVMEVTSIALVQERVAGCEFDVGVFTNLTQDHLDDHGSMEAYAAAKQRLFTMLGQGPLGGEPAKGGAKAAVINVDETAARQMIEACRVPVLTYGVDRPADFRAQDVRIEPSGTRFTLLAPDGSHRVRLPLMGRFNVYNALAALAAVHVEGIPVAEAVDGLARAAPVPGRFERVEAGQPFPVIVDYAHTPDSLEKLLLTARDFTPGRLIAVFGCGGDRDPGKRPVMGRIAARWADYLILTSDNPRSEDPARILADIEAGIAAGRHRNRPRERIADRREAIARAVAIARPGDTVVIAGKGHETYQIFRDRTVPFDDRLVAAEALRARAGSSA